MAHDFIPPADDQFNTFLTELCTYIATSGATLGLAPAQITEAAAQLDLWTTGYTDWQNIQNQYESLRAAKDEARLGAEAFARQVNAAAQAKPGQTAAVLEAAGLPVRKTTRTPTAEIDTHPVLYRVDNEHLLQRLWFCDQNTPGSKAKPHGAAYCEIRQQLVAAGAPAPVDPDAMPFLASDSKVPHRTDLEAEDLGKTAYYAQRWVNKLQEPGPWGPITGYPVV